MTQGTAFSEIYLRVAVYGVLHFTFFYEKSEDNVALLYLMDIL